MGTVGRMLRHGAAHLRHHSDSAGLDARLLLAHALGLSTSRLYSRPQASVAPADFARFQQLLQRRAAGEPVAYITGRCGFWTLELDVSPAVLIPRADTETLVQAALDTLAETNRTVVDLGTGSGAVALALACERPDWTIWATEASEPALECARANAARLALAHIRFVRGNWFEPLAGRRVDAIVCNPPYIGAGDPHLHAPELGYEPVAALLAGGAGLADLAHVTANAPRHLNPGGWLLLEHGCDQGEAVRAMLRRAGLQTVATRPDLAGRPRVTLGRAG